MNRCLNLLVVASVLLSAGMMPSGLAQAQVPVVAHAGPASLAVPPGAPSTLPADPRLSNPPPPGPRGLLAFAAGAGQPLAPETIALAGEAAAPEGLGDWSNTAALACMLPLGAVYNYNTVASLFAKPPPLDLPPSLAAYAANLALKFCAPYVAPPPSFVQGDQGGCQAEFYQPRTAGSNFNVMGSKSPSAMSSRASPGASSARPRCSTGARG
jgi:hypothetical protein